MTPLLLAAMNGHPSVVQILLREKADPFSVDVRHKVSCLFSFPFSFQIDGRNALMAATESGEIDSIRFLLEAKISANAVNVTLSCLCQRIPLFYVEQDRGRAALHYAAAKGHDDVVRFLVEECGAKLSIKDQVAHPLSRKFPHSQM